MKNDDMQNGVGQKRIISIPPTYFYACVLFNLAMLFWPPVSSPILFPLRVLGGVLFLIGCYVIMNTYFLFRKHGTSEKFIPSSCVVTRGLYRYSRNPMYLGMIIMLLGVFGLVARWEGFLSPLIFFVVIHGMFIPYEEEKMERECGPDYLKYKKSVRRWL